MGMFDPVGKLFEDAVYLSTGGGASRNVWDWAKKQWGSGPLGGRQGPSVVSEQLPTVTPEQMSWLQAFMRGEYGPQQGANQVAAMLAAMDRPNTNLGYTPSGTTADLINRLSQPQGFDATTGWTPDPRTKEIIDQLSAGVPFNQDLVNEAFQRNVSDPAMKQFREEVQPGIAANLSGSLFSSGTRRAGDAATANLLTNLSAERSRTAESMQRFQTEQTTQRLGLAGQQTGVMNAQTLANSQAELQGRITKSQQALDSLMAAGKLSSDVDGQRLDAMKAELSARMQANQQQIDALTASGQISNQQAALLAAVMAIPQIENVAGVDPGDPSTWEIIMAILSGGAQGAGAAAASKASKPAAAAAA